MDTGRETTPAEKLTYDDLVRFPDDGLRHEIIDGAHFVTASPNLWHQRVVRRLSRWLDDYVTAHSLGELFPAPLDVILTNHDVVEPDIVVARPSQLSGRWIEGPPLLAVEILSPSTARADRDVKFRRYAELGIDHYWIVDPDEHMIECFRVRDGRYETVARAGRADVLTHPDFPGLVIAGADLWRG